MFISLHWQEVVAYLYIDITIQHKVFANISAPPTLNTTFHLEDKHRVPRSIRQVHFDTILKEYVSFAS